MATAVTESPSPLVAPFASSLHDSNSSLLSDSSISTGSSLISHSDSSPSPPHDDSSMHSSPNNTHGEYPPEVFSPPPSHPGSREVSPSSSTTSSHTPSTSQQQSSPPNSSSSSCWISAHDSKLAAAAMKLGSPPIMGLFPSPYLTSRLSGRTPKFCPQSPLMSSASPALSSFKAPARRIATFSSSPLLPSKRFNTQSFTHSSLAGESASSSMLLSEADPALLKDSPALEALQALSSPSILPKKDTLQAMSPLLSAKEPPKDEDSVSGISGGFGGSRSFTRSLQKPYDVFSPSTFLRSPIVGNSHAISSSSFISGVLPSPSFPRLTSPSLRSSPAGLLPLSALSSSPLFSSSLSLSSPLLSAFWPGFSDKGAFGLMAQKKRKSDLLDGSLSMSIDSNNTDYSEDKSPGAADGEEFTGGKKQRLSERYSQSRTLSFRDGSYSSSANHEEFDDSLAELTTKDEDRKLGFTQDMNDIAAAMALHARQSQLAAQQQQQQDSTPEDGSSHSGGSDPEAFTLQESEHLSVQEDSESDQEQEEEEDDTRSQNGDEQDEEDKDEQKKKPTSKRVSSSSSSSSNVKRSTRIRRKTTKINEEEQALTKQKPKRKPKKSSNTGKPSNNKSAAERAIGRSSSTSASGSNEVTSSSSSHHDALPLDAEMILLNIAAVLSGRQPVPLTSATSDSTSSSSSSSFSASSSSSNSALNGHSRGSTDQDRDHEDMADDVNEEMTEEMAEEENDAALTLASVDENGKSLLTPKAGNGSGSSCHQCKSRRQMGNLIFCCNMFTKRPGKGRRRVCRKKYCWQCLLKFYHEHPPKKRQDPSSNWQCPACRGICSCALCRRVRQEKTEQSAFLGGENCDAATSLAFGFVYFNKIDVLGADGKYRFDVLFKKWLALTQGGQDSKAAHELVDLADLADLPQTPKPPPAVT